MRPQRKIVALSGGVGGAKLALGLDRVLAPGCLSVVANTGDDFVHMGLHISPDIDTLLYTLSGRSDRERGWGRADESWNFMQATRELGGEDWFQLGDKDLALHVFRTQNLKAGRDLTETTGLIGSSFGIASRVLPMSDDAVRTMVDTAEGPMEFQRYFVHRRCEPVAVSLRFEGAATARLSGEVQAALNDPSLEGIIICPSNPYLSVDPILAVPGMRAALRAAGCPIVAVSPLIAGRAIKGPTAKIMAELGVPVTNVAIARHYHGLIDGLVIDGLDAADAAKLDIPVAVEETLMSDDQRKVALAERVLNLCAGLSERRR